MIAVPIARFFIPTIAAIMLLHGLADPLSAQDKKTAPITIGYAGISGSFAPLWVAHDHGLFAKHGVDVKVAYIQGSRVMMQALTAGEIQAYQGGGPKA